MNRSEFLKTLGLSSTGLFLPRALAENRAIRIYDNYLAGLMHYDMKKVEGQIKEGDELQLNHEVTNPYDAFAVEVFWQDHKLGYLPAFENIVPANMLDQGVELKAFVSKKALHPSYQSALAIEIYAHLLLPGKELIKRENQPGRANDVMDIYRGNL